MFIGGVWMSEHLVAIMKEHGEYCLRVALSLCKGLGDGRRNSPGCLFFLLSAAGSL